jgi:hypothetical protein
LRPFWHEIFADGTLRQGFPADADWPAHWPEDELRLRDFNDAWRTWAATLDSPDADAGD